MFHHQRRVAGWMQECFGPEISADKVERNDRFIEEALELAQSTGFTAERAHALVDYVFNRPAGEPGQEVGGVMVTLAALCNVHDLNIADEADREVARITTPEMVAKIRAKQAAKPTGSALPAATAETSSTFLDAQRYRVLRIVGAAPAGTLHLVDGNVFRAGNLDAWLDHYRERGIAPAPSRFVEYGPRFAADLEQDSEPVHAWFGLTYSSYLVLPRIAMQAMPIDWQMHFVRLMDQAVAAGLNAPSYHVLRADPAYTFVERYDSEDETSRPYRFTAIDEDEWANYRRGDIAKICPGFKAGGAAR